MKGSSMEKAAKRYVNSATGEVVSELPSGAELVDYKSGMKLPNSTSGGDLSKDWSNWAFAGGGGLLAHAIVSSILEKSEEEKRKESPWMKLIRVLAPIGAGAAGAYAGYNLGKGLGKSAQTAAGPVRFYDADAAGQDKADTAGVQEAGSWGSYLGGLGSGYLGARSAKDWYRISAAQRKLPKVEAEIRGIEGATSGGAGAAAARMAEHRMGKIIGRFNARPVSDAAGAAADMAEMRNLGSFAKNMQTPHASAVNGAKLKASLDEYGKLQEMARKSKAWAKGKTIGGLTGAAALAALGYGLGNAAEKNRAEAARLRGE